MSTGTPVMARAMLLDRQHAPLRAATIEVAPPGPGQLRLRVDACAVCRTDLHIVDGELPRPKLPLVLGHEIAGTVDHLGDGVTGFAPGDRVGVPWLAWTCGVCSWCTSGRENLCSRARFTGYDVDGGYAEYTVADSRYCLTLPASRMPRELAPLLCAGLIGFRAYRMAGPAERLGLYGFGAAAHLIAQVAVAEGREVYAFTRPGDRDAQRFAMTLGATWAGSSEEMPPMALDAALIFAPVGALVPAALRAVRPAGTVVCGGIRMSDIPSFPYEILWGERLLRSVANLTRQDGVEFMKLAATTPIRVETVPYPLDRANDALADLRAGRIQGAAVLEP